MVIQQIFEDFFTISSHHFAVKLFPVLFLHPILRKDILILNALNHALHLLYFFVLLHKCQPLRYLNHKGFEIFRFILQYVFSQHSRFEKFFIIFCK